MFVSIELDTILNGWTMGWGFFLDIGTPIALVGNDYEIKH